MLARRQELNTQLQVLIDAFLLALSLWAAYERTIDRRAPATQSCPRRTTRTGAPRWVAAGFGGPGTIVYSGTKITHRSRRADRHRAATNFRSGRSDAQARGLAGNFRRR